MIIIGFIVCAVIAVFLIAGIIAFKVLLVALGAALLIIAILAMIAPFTALLITAIANPAGRLTVARSTVLACSAIAYAALAAIWISDGLEWGSFPLIGYLLTAVLTATGYATLVPSWTETAVTTEHFGPDTFPRARHKSGDPHDAVRITPGPGVAPA